VLALVLRAKARAEMRRAMVENVDFRRLMRILSKQKIVTGDSRKNGVLLVADRETFDCFRFSHSFSPRDLFPW
jgi:hypothetical protein